MVSRPSVESFDHDAFDDDAFDDDDDDDDEAEGGDPVISNAYAIFGGMGGFWLDSSFRV